MGPVVMALAAGFATGTGITFAWWCLTSARDFIVGVFDRGETNASILAKVEEVRAIAFRYNRDELLDACDKYIESLERVEAAQGRGN